MLQDHYNPQLEAVHGALQVARAETDAALQAKAEAEQQLKLAFMRATSKLNLEVSAAKPKGAPRSDLLSAMRGHCKS